MKTNIQGLQWERKITLVKSHDNIHLVLQINGIKFK